MLDLYDYDESVTCEVVVVRVVEHGSAESDRYPTGFGVKIVDCDDANRARLTTMLERAKRGGDLY